MTHIKLVIGGTRDERVRSERLHSVSSSSHNLLHCQLFHLWHRQSGMAQSSDNGEATLHKDVHLIEFFSGIGGMRLGVEKACQESSSSDGHSRSWSLLSCVALEIADNANKIYRHNFVETASSSSQSSCLICQEIQRVNSVPWANLWTMSPPCQPFCSKPGAKHLDMEDSRCQGFQGVIRLLEEKEHNDRPRWILLENVKGFATSKMLDVFKTALQRCGYTFKQYLLSPTQFGVPNHRMRFYLICEKSMRFANVQDSLFTEPPSQAAVRPKKGVAEYLDDNHTPNPMLSVVQENSESGSSNRTSLYVPNWVLEKPWAKELDFVGPEDTITHCFTSSYGRIYHPASGSLYCANKVSDDINNSETNRTTNDSLVSQFGDGKSRRFTPREIANFLDFPEWFSFPPDLALERQYKHIANAVNVTVVAALVRELLT